MHYKIVSVNEEYPEDPIVQHGEFTLNERALENNPTGNHPILQALAAEYGGGDPHISAVLNLKEWSGGESSYWSADLADQPEVETLSVIVNEWTYHVTIADEPFADSERGQLLKQIKRKLQGCDEATLQHIIFLIEDPWEWGTGK